MNAKRDSLRTKLNVTRDQKFDLLTTFVLGRRLLKPITKRLRNMPIGAATITDCRWNHTISHMAYFYLSMRVNSMKDTSSLLAKIDDIPGDALTDTNGWTTTDDKHSGTRSFQRTFMHRSVDVTIILTAIPIETSVDGTPRCRKVVVGQETKTETNTYPLYEIVCDD